METTTYNLTVNYITPLLGSQPTRQIASVHIAHRSGFELPEDEIETLPDALERGTTVFHKLDNGDPIYYDYYVRGMLKGAGDAFNGKINGIRALKSKIEKYVFVVPRVIPIQKPKGMEQQGWDDLTDYLERPIRAETAKGPRVALARSEMLPEGCWFRCGLEVFPCEITESVLRELLDYGYYNGISQWRGGGFGRFTYVLVKEE
jgi:hypothetical protein